LRSACGDDVLPIFKLLSGAAPRRAITAAHPTGRAHHYKPWEHGHEDNSASDIVGRKFDVRNSRQRVGRAAHRCRRFCARRMSGSFDMTENIKSRCNAPRPLRLTGAFFVATSIGLMSASTAGAGDSSGYVRGASCTLVRYYVAKYSASAAEAWARSKGATDLEINKARRCITPQHTAQAGRADRAF
jgi:hypothetical protein